MIWFILVFVFFCNARGMSTENLKLKAALEKSDFITLEKLIKEDKSLLCKPFQSPACSPLTYALVLLSNCPLTIDTTELERSILFLIERGAPVNDREPSKKMTNLHIAVLCGVESILDALLAKKPLLNARDAEKNTPLHCAVCSQNHPCIKKLCAHGASIAIQDNNGYTPLEIAIIHKKTEIITLLTQRSKIKKAMNEFDILEILNLAPTLLEYPLHDQNYLHYVLNEYDLQRYFFRIGQKTACNIFSYERKLESILEILIHQKQSVDATDFMGETPLHKAARMGLTNIVTMLLRHKASLNILTSSDETALDLAFYHNHPGLVELLLKNGCRRHKQQTPIPKDDVPCLSINELKKMLDPSFIIPTPPTTPLKKEIIPPVIAKRKFF